MSNTRNIIRNATRNISEPLNIITAPTHEAYETNLTKTNHNFYTIQHPSFKKWMTQYRPVPNNYYILPDTNLPTHVDFDLVLSQNKFGQYQILSDIARQLRIPIISIEHALPMPNWDQNTLTQLRNMYGHVNLFISEFSKNAWGFDNIPNSNVVHHCVDSELFCPTDIERQSHILSVVNDWIGRDWCCGFQSWTRITKDLPVLPIGDTKGLSKPAKDVDELVKFYQESQVFINTSTISPIPTALLEAMSCECACISTATCMIPEIIEHGVNGLISNNEEELRHYCQLCLSDKELCRKLGKAARQTIIEKFGINKFLATWNRHLFSVLRD